MTMKRKQDYPLVALKAINPLLDISHELIEKEESGENCIVRFRSLDFNEFHFCIKEYSGLSGSKKPIFKYLCRPADENSNQIHSSNAEIADIQRRFAYWLDLLKGYKDVRNPHENIDDSILVESQQEIYELFELVDEDADEKSYDLGRQLAIDKFIDVSVKLIEDKRTNENTEQVDELVEEAFNIKNNQQNWTKRKVVKALAWFTAKVKRFSLSLAVEVLKELGKEFIIRSITSGP